MKYLREVTPYFRKTSILSELAWGTGTLSREGSLGRNGALNDKVTIPLRLCFACRGMAGETVDRRTFELHSHDLKNCCQFRCSDEAAANQWLQEIHATLYALTQHAISDANRLLNNDHLPNSSGEIRHMGWLAQQVSWMHWFALFYQFRDNSEGCAILDCQYFSVATLLFAVIEQLALLSAVRYLASFEIWITCDVSTVTLRHCLLFASCRLWALLSARAAGERRSPPSPIKISSCTNRRRARAMSGRTRYRVTRSSQRGQRQDVLSSHST